MTTRFERVLEDGQVKREKKAKPKVEPPPPKLTFQEKITINAYVSKLPYPGGTRDPETKKARLAYSEDQARLDVSFKADLFEEFGVTKHPKAELCFRKAWEHGHSSGYAAVADWFEDLVELL